MQAGGVDLQSTPEHLRRLRHPPRQGPLRLPPHRRDGSRWRPRRPVQDARRRAGADLRRLFHHLRWGACPGGLEPDRGRVSRGPPPGAAGRRRDLLHAWRDGRPGRVGSGGKAPRRSAKDPRGEDPDRRLARSPRDPHRADGEARLWDRRLPHLSPRRLLPDRLPRRPAPPPNPRRWRQAGDGGRAGAGDCPRG